MGGLYVDSIPQPHLGAACLQLRDNARVVALIPGDQVGALQDQPKDGCIGRELNILAGVVPVQVLLQVLVHGCGTRNLGSGPMEHGGGVAVHVR